MDLVMRGSTKGLRALAFASVVSIRLFRMREDAMLESIALR